VQDTRENIERERERDNLKRRGKNLGTFPKKKKGTNPKANCVTVLDFFLFWREYYMDPYYPYNRGKGRKFRY
jgi:hypothetical protein